MEVGVQGHAPAALLPGKTRYPLFRRLGGPYGRSERVKKISPTTGFDPRIVFYVVSRYTDWAIAANKWIYIYIHTYIYIYTNTYLDIRKRSGLSVYNSQWTNSATHSSPFQQQITMNYDETPGSFKLPHFYFYTFSSQVQFISCSYCMNVFCLCWRCWQGMGRIDICAIAEG